MSKRKLMSTLAIASTLLLSACAGPTRQVADNRIELGPRAKQYLSVSGPYQTFVSSNLLKAGIEIQNASSFKHELRYRIAWFDASGFEIKGLASRWESVVLTPRETQSLSRIAPTPQAQRYRFYLFDINTINTSTTQRNPQ